LKGDHVANSSLEIEIILKRFDTLNILGGNTKNGGGINPMGVSPKELLKMGWGYHIFAD
jgi:hypothetical protein